MGWLLPVVVPGGILRQRIFPTLRIRVWWIGTGTLLVELLDIKEVLWVGSENSVSIT